MHKRCAAAGSTLSCDMPDIHRPIHTDKIKSEVLGCLLALWFEFKSSEMPSWMSMMMNEHVLKAICHRGPTFTCQSEGGPGYHVHRHRYEGTDRSVPAGRFRGLA